MRSLLAFAFLGVALGGTCPCSDASLCEPIATPYGQRPEVLGFVVSPTNWHMYPLKNVTTLALFFPVDQLDPQFVCTAHAAGVRIVWAANYDVDQLGNATMRGEWVDAQVKLVQNTHADGINLDFESPIVDGSPAAAQLTSLTKELTTKVHAANPHYQISFDVAWSPAGIDGRFFDYVGLAGATDFLVVMSYDERSQVKVPGPCLAGPNSALNVTKSGVLRFLKEGISASRLVLGTPWYGYQYTCLSRDGGEACTIAEVPFRGVNCSDAAGKQVNVADIEALGLDVEWSAAADSPYANSGQYQYWFDDARSLALKYALAGELGLGGIATWNTDAVAYSDPLPALTRSIWNVFYVPRG